MNTKSFFNYHRAVRVGGCSFASTLAIIAATATNVAAQDAVPQIDERDQIVVTALKRETNLLETPLSISAFSGDQLENSGADGLEEFLQFAPGVQFDNSANGAQRIFIRGLTSQIGNTPVGFYLDEVPFTALTVTSTPDVRSFDLERVEVLRGPQGTLYGASSLGGTVRILTNDPVHNEVQAKGDFTYSSTDEGGGNHGLKAAVNIPLIEDKLSLRVVGTQEEYSGWIDQQDFLNFGPPAEEVNDYNVWTARAKLKYTVSDNVEVILGYWHDESDSGAGNLTDDDGQSNSLVNPTTGAEISSDLYSGEISIDFDSVSLTSSTSYIDRERFNPFNDFSGFFSSTDVSIFNQELRLTSNADGRFFWTVGGIYTSNETEATTFFVLPPLLVLDTTQNIEGKSFAIYGEGTYSITDSLDATVGLRYFEDEVTRNDTSLGVLQPEIVNEFDDLSPRFNLAWTPTEDVLLFATASKGFRSGLTQATVSIVAAQALNVDIPLAIDPEEAWNYEIGSKLSLFDDRLTLDGVIYYIDYSNLQTQFLFDSFVFGTLNAGDVDAYGFEFATSLEIVENLTFNFSGNINDTTYRDTVTDASGFVTIFPEGQQVVLTPEVTLSGSLNYIHNISDDWRAIGRASVEYNGARDAIDATFSVISGDPNTRVNLRLGVENDKYGIYAFAENLNNDDNAIVPLTTAAAAGLGYASRYRPRTIGVNLKVNY
ncbi:MAG: TonB-dependent receptor [Pseudomonadota bacterium]